MPDSKQLCCDKCGRPVHPSNSAILVDRVFHGLAMTEVYSYSRHFLPVYDGKEMVCEGSPSRAQYIEGQPADTRGYRYIEDYEPRFRAAYAAVLVEHPAPVEV